MKLPALIALLPASLFVAGQGGEPGTAGPSAPIPAHAVWDANAWDPGSADSFWRKVAPSDDRPAPNSAARTESAPGKPAEMKSSSFSSRQTGK